MAMGKPVISTSKGAEGIDYTSGTNIIIEDDIDLFSDRIIELLTYPKKAFSIGAHARSLIRDKYNWEIYKKELITIYSNLIS